MIKFQSNKSKVVEKDVIISVSLRNKDYVNITKKSKFKTNCFLNRSGLGSCQNHMGIKKVKEIFSGKF